jgi:hypothetical protein
MSKQQWGNATWRLFHTLAAKLKPEYSAEVAVLFTHISNICNNLPCPDCQQHATQFISRQNKSLITASKDSLMDFLWRFHNMVNKKTGKADMSKAEVLDLYSRAKTLLIYNHFVKIMSISQNNSKAMMNSFHRRLYLTKFNEYMQANMYKYQM